MADEAVRKSVWAERLTWLALALSIGGLVAALIGAVGSGQGAWHFRDGFTVLRYAFFASLAGGLVAILASFLCRRDSRRSLLWLNLLAFLVALGFLIYLGNQIATARSVPAIHDVTTNLEDVPQFTKLRVREDNLENIPDNGDPALAALDPETRWATIHRQAYGDVRTIKVPWNVPETVRRAEALALERGWEVVHSDPAAGILEATDTSLFFRFKDDVVIRVRPSPNVNGGSFVDMRSISRVGGSDVGVNAKRIRSFLRDLREG